MTSKISKYIIKIVIILIIFQILTMPQTQALSWEQIFSTGENFINNGKSASDQQGEEVLNTSGIKQASTDIYTILLALGVVLAVIVGGILGIQLMWGSIEQQVKAKEMLMPYAVGCIVTFGAFGLWKLAVTIFSQL